MTIVAMSKITLLGTGTSQITLERRASSALIELDKIKILFDCGHGVLQRLLEVEVHPNTINHLILSHFHADHVSDLIPFFHAGAKLRYNPRTTDLHVYGPIGLQDFIDKIKGLFRQGTFELPTYKIIIHETLEEHFEISSYSFDFISLPPCENHGLRFTHNGKSIAITGDSYFHKQEIFFLKNTDLAIIDAGHLKDDELIQLAVESQAKVIICSHIFKEIDAPQLQSKARKKGYRGEIKVGKDLMKLPLDEDLQGKHSFDGDMQKENALTLSKSGSGR